MARKNIELFKHINEAFIKGDTAFIEENAVDDVQWTFVGKTPVQGKSELIKAMESMESDTITDITFTNTITHGNVAAINGSTREKILSQKRLKKNGDGCMSRLPVRWKHCISYPQEFFHIGGKW